VASAEKGGEEVEEVNGHESRQRRAWNEEEMMVAQRRCGAEGKRRETTGRPPGVSDVWQTKDLQTAIFGSVASKGLTGEFSDLWQLKDLAAFLQEVGNC